MSLHRENSNLDFDTSFLNVDSILMELFPLEDMTSTSPDDRWSDVYLINVRPLKNQFERFSLQNNAYVLLYLHSGERTIISIYFLWNSQLFPLLFNRVSEKCEKV